MTITRADRDLEEQLIDCYFVKDGDDPDHEKACALIAAHREAAEARAREEGAKAMQWRAWDYCRHYGARSGILECAKIASGIAALDPAQIAGGKP